MVADIIFVVDTSFTVQRTAIVNFLKSVVGRIGVGVGAARVALVSFGSGARVHFGLGSQTDKQTVLNTIDQLQFFGGLQESVPMISKQ